ncbi:MAG: class I SAM-dependent methyltransferase [Ktedonobacterales bacterium]
MSNRSDTDITRTAYYDRIARQWHRITGHSGGAFKRYVLNDVLIEAIGGVEGVAILELGAGNGYFLPLVMRRYSGQRSARIVISDFSSALLTIAQSELRVVGAEYLQLDVRESFPFANGSFDLLLATMLFNELSDGELRRALAECVRVLRPGGRLLATVTHPAFVANLAKRGELRDLGRGLAALPGAEGLPLPVARRSVAGYISALHAAGFSAQCGDVRADDWVRHEKPGLRHAGDVPLALVLECERPQPPITSTDAPLAE